MPKPRHSPYLQPSQKREYLLTTLSSLPPSSKLRNPPGRPPHPLSNEPPPPLHQLRHQGVIILRLLLGALLRPLRDRAIIQTRPLQRFLQTTERRPSNAAGLVTGGGRLSTAVLLPPPATRSLTAGLRLFFFFGAGGLRCNALAFLPVGMAGFFCPIRFPCVFGRFDADGAAATSSSSSSPNSRLRLGTLFSGRKARSLRTISSWS